MTDRRHRKEQGPLINEKIRFDKMQLIASDGENRGVVSRTEALRAAQDAGLDLVIIAEKGGMGEPVAKVMDFGKMLYEKKKQQAEAKKKQQVIQVKEVKFRPKIAEGDYQTKLRRAIGFLEKGKHVKVTLMFRGREIPMKHELGPVLFDRIQNDMLSAGFGQSLVQGKDSKSVQQWSRIYFIKNKK